MYLCVGGGACVGGYKKASGIVIEHEIQMVFESKQRIKNSEGLQGGYEANNP